MKRILLTLLVSVLCYLQNGEAATRTHVLSGDSIPHTGIFLKNRNIIYQKVFSSNLTKEDLADKVATLLSTTRDFRFARGNHFSDWEFFGRLSDHKFDLGKFNTGVFNTPTIFGVPMNAVVVVQVKDYKYRITISEMVFKLPKDNVRKEPEDLLLDDLITQKGRSLIKQSKSNIKIAGMLDQELTDIFDLNRSVTGSDF